MGNLSDDQYKKLEKHIQSFESIGNKNKFKYLSSFRNTVYGYRILIEILKLNNHSLLSNHNTCTKEHLTKTIATLASRATIINFIKDQIASGALYTVTDEKDKRVKIIKPSLELIEEFKSWIDVLYT